MQSKTNKDTPILKESSRKLACYTTRRGGACDTFEGRCPGFPAQRTWKQEVHFSEPGRNKQQTIRQTLGWQHVHGFHRIESNGLSNSSWHPYFGALLQPVLRVRWIRRGPSPVLNFGCSQRGNDGTMRQIMSWMDAGKEQRTPRVGIFDMSQILFQKQPACHSEIRGDMGRPSSAIAGQKLSSELDFLSSGSLVNSGCLHFVQTFAVLLTFLGLTCCTSSHGHPQPNCLFRLFRTPKPRKHVDSRPMAFVLLRGHEQPAWPWRI